MEHKIRANSPADGESRRPFRKVEAQVIAALEQQGLVVQRSFSLHSAAAADGYDAETRPGYSVLLLYTSGLPPQLLGLLTLYELQGQILLRTELAAASDAPGRSEADLCARRAMLALDELLLRLEGVDAALHFTLPHRGDEA